MVLIPEDREEQDESMLKTSNNQVQKHQSFTNKISSAGGSIVRKLNHPMPPQDEWINQHPKRHDPNEMPLQRLGKEGLEHRVIEEKKLFEQKPIMLPTHYLQPTMIQ
jgi:hypothetical protein